MLARRGLLRPVVHSHYNISLPAAPCRSLVVVRAQAVVSQQESQLRGALERQQALSAELEEQRRTADEYQVCACVCSSVCSSMCVKQCVCSSVCSSVGSHVCVCVPRFCPGVLGLVCGMLTACSMFL